MIGSKQQLNMMVIIMIIRAWLTGQRPAPVPVRAERRTR